MPDDPKAPEEPKPAEETTPAATLEETTPTLTPEVLPEAAPQAALEVVPEVTRATEPLKATEIAVDAPKGTAKSELPPELKTVHSSPPPRDTPLVQEDDAPNDYREREKLLDDAISFLETGSVRDAPAQEKQVFLQSKGLTAAKAQELIGNVGRARRRRSKKKGKAVAQSRKVQNTVAPLPPPPPPSPQPVLQMQSTPTILTYPEWLAPPPPPGSRPLMSGATLVSSLYLGAATAATVYGANKFVVTPMLDALTSARLDFTATVKKNLDELNTRLLELAPASYALGKGLHRSRDTNDDDSDASSEISDPSELFHVDAQTQTTPSLSGHDDEMDAGAMTPDSKLEELTSQMKALVESHSDGTDNELTFLLEDLTSYLEGLNYDSAVSNNIFATSNFGYGDKDKDDPILKVKQEIRSVKGVLLNAKNFPASK